MFCKNCGKEVKEDWKICPSCGTAIGEEKEAAMTKKEAKKAAKEAKKNKKKRKKLPLILLAIVVVIVILVVMGGGEDSPSKSIANLDLAEYVSRDGSKLLEDCDDLEFVEDYGCYMDESQQVMVMLDEDDNLYAIGINSGDNTSLPAFAGVKIGESADFTVSDLEKYGYEFLTIEGNYYYYGNAETDAVVRFERTSDDTIYSISWDAEGCGEIENALYATGDESMDLTTDEKSDSDIPEAFIGREGTYICTSASEGDYTGRVDISEISSEGFNFSLGTLELSYSFITEYAQIIDSNTAQITIYGVTLTFSWTDAENMTISRSGEFTGMDAGPMGDITNNQTYTRPLEFNQ